MYIVSETYATIKITIKSLNFTLHTSHITV